MRNSRGGPLRLLGTLRGEGVLFATTQVRVRYQVDLFRRGSMMIASGELEGRFSPVKGRDLRARLRLEDGAVVDVTLRDVGADLAAFDVDEAGAQRCHEMAAGGAPAAPLVAD
jgi:hypothetical protein